MNWEELEKTPNPLRTQPGRGLFDGTGNAGIFDTRAANTADITISKPRRLATTAAGRAFVSTADLAAAIDHIGALPDPEQTLHFVTAGSYKGWDVVPAVLKLAGDTICEELIVTTYAFNIPQITALAELIDAGQVITTTLICALLFQKIRPAVILQATEELQARGGRVLAVRNHTKLYLWRLADGRHFAAESCANLRSRGAIEQWTLTQSQELWAFHREWIEELFARTHR